LENVINFNWVGIETLAVVLAIIYLFLAIKENSLCWYFVFLSAAIYIWIFINSSLYMASLLNIYYAIMSIYGLYQWRRGGVRKSGLPIKCLSSSHHIFIIISVISLSLFIGYFLGSHTDSKLPYLDSFAALSSIVTTIMVARKILENWLYWIAIDAVSIYLYFSQDLYQTAILFVLYMILSIMGYYEWRKRYLSYNRS
jgi:nicotinamide mononucleotide transporter